jgi:dTDP-4-amino-4,6-dideoxygalactose transaminase
VIARKIAAVHMKPSMYDVCEVKIKALVGPAKSTQGELVHSVDLYRNLLTLPVAHAMTDAAQRRDIDVLETAISAY